MQDFPDPCLLPLPNAWTTDWCLQTPNKNGALVGGVVPYCLNSKLKLTRNSQRGQSKGFGSQVYPKAYELLEYVLSDTSFWAQKFFKNWVKLYSDDLFYAITLYNTHISHFFYQLFWINIIIIYIKGFRWILRRRVPSW